MYINDLKPGDLLLWRIGLERRGLKRLLSKLIGFFQPIIDEGGSLKKTYSHVAMVDKDIRYMLESTWPKSCRSEINIPTSPYRLEVYRVKRANEIFYQDGDTRVLRVDMALNWAYAHLGQHYDVMQLLSMGLINVKNQEVCSTFVCKSYLHGGIVLSTEGIKDSFSSPNEITDNKVEVEFIGELEA